MRNVEPASVPPAPAETESETETETRGRRRLEGHWGRQTGVIKGPKGEVQAARNKRCFFGVFFGRR